MESLERQITRRTPAILENMPYDIFFLIAQHSDYRSLRNLTQTNTAFHSQLDLDALAPLEARQQYFLEIEHFKQHEMNFACFTCWRMLPQSAFARGHRTGRRGKYSTYPERQVTRFCWECAAKHRLAPHLQPTSKDGLLWYLCHRCGEFKLKSDRCGPEECSQSRVTRLAVEPWSKFETLPETLHMKIFGLLDYRDAIRLSQTSRFFHRAVKPLECTSLSSKALFIRNVFNPSGSFTAMMTHGVGCYLCFTLMPYHNSAGWQHMWMETCGNWTWMCMKCNRLIRAPGHTQAGHDALVEWNRRETCPVCGGLKYMDEQCERCVEGGTSVVVLNSSHYRLLYSNGVPTAWEPIT